MKEKQLLLTIQKASGQYTLPTIHNANFNQPNKQLQPTANIFKFLQPIYFILYKIISGTLASENIRSTITGIVFKRGTRVS